MTDFFATVWFPALLFVAGMYVASLPLMWLANLGSKKAKKEYVFGFVTFLFSPFLLFVIYILLFAECVEIVLTYFNEEKRIERTRRFLEQKGFVVKEKKKAR